MSCAGRLTRKRGAIIGNPLESVLHAFIVSRPEFDTWLAERARAVAENLSDRQKSQRLAKLDEQIAEATDKLREARKAQALAKVEAEFASVSGEAA
jgi:flavin-dependent dehydrogenase